MENDFIKCEVCGDNFNPKYLDQVFKHIHEGVELNQTIKGEKTEGWNVGDKFTTPETGDKVFYVSKVRKYDVEARDSRSCAGYTIFTKSWIIKQP